VVHKKINASDTYVPWAHEQFARQKILGTALLFRSIASFSFADVDFLL